MAVSQGDGVGCGEDGMGGGRGKVLSSMDLEAKYISKRTNI